MKCLIILYSYHHKNTEKVAKVMSKILDAKIKNPQQINTEELNEYNLIGFGSGIYSQKHHELLLDLVDRLTKVTHKKAFIFSTSAIVNKSKVEEDHLLLKKKLISKGYDIIDEFACKGFNTNSFMKYFGGMNKGRPNDQDLKQAELFAQKLKQNILLK